MPIYKAKILNKEINLNYEIYDKDEVKMLPNFVHVLVSHLSLHMSKAIAIYNVIFYYYQRNTL